MTNQTQDKDFQDSVQAEFYSQRPTEQTVQQQSTPEPTFTDSMTPLFRFKDKSAKKKENKFHNNCVKTAVGTRITAVMDGCTYVEGYGAVISYKWGNYKIYDLMDVPGVSKAANDERKMRYLQMFGSRPETAKRALDKPRSFAASVGTIWGHHVKHDKKKIDAVLEVYRSGSYCYFALISGQIKSVQ